MGTKQNVETTNLHKKVFSPWDQLKFMTIDKPSAHQILKTKFEISTKFYVIDLCKVSRK